MGWPTFTDRDGGNSVQSASAGEVPVAGGDGDVTWQSPPATPARFTRVPTVYDVAGADQHVVSADAYAVDIEAWGGGGGASADGLSGSGAGGEYAFTGAVPVVPTDVLDIVVGAGGTTNPGSDNGNPGGLSSVTDDTPTLLCEANGGEGAAATGIPADGGTGGVGDITINGGPGGASAGIGGLAWNRGGDSPNGGAGGSGIGTGSQQSPAVQPGGGGGGATATNGMDGAPGRVIIWEWRVSGI